MKILTTNTIIKKIILVLLVIIMLNNFIMPNYVMAKEDIVDKLIKGFFGLLAKLGDVVIQTMQYVMCGVWTIEGMTGYEILYSPGIIFSDLVPGLKIDFIGQDVEQSKITYSGQFIRTAKQYELLWDEATSDSSRIEQIEYDQTSAHRVLYRIVNFTVVQLTAEEMGMLASKVDTTVMREIASGMVGQFMDLSEFSKAWYKLLTGLEDAPDNLDEFCLSVAAFAEMWNNRFEYINHYEEYSTNQEHLLSVWHNIFMARGLNLKSFLSGEWSVDEFKKCIPLDTPIGDVVERIDAIPEMIWDAMQLAISAVNPMASISVSQLRPILYQFYANITEQDIEDFNEYAKLPLSYGGMSDLFDILTAIPIPMNVELLNRALRQYTSEEEAGVFAINDGEFKFIFGDYIYHLKNNNINGAKYIMQGQRVSLKGVNFDSATQEFYKDNIDSKLKPQISKWYNALRTVALVGLLSVLVYIGIRIILSSSSAQDKAKYKNMLKDWLVALCILFVLHYIMAFMLQFNKALNNILRETVIVETLEENYTDELMNSVRDSVGNIKEASLGKAAGYTLMWLVMVILTLTFTFQYLKRVIYMAFLTMIAPMIALTYPLDKIKDSKAQAFSFWLREYIFQCLIQPVHLLLYSMLIGSAIDFAIDNILYALVALGFMVPAEKLIKQMFGMKSETSAGNFSAAMGGAAVMNMMNKLKGVGPKGGSKDSESSGGGSKGNGGVRTASNRTGGASTGSSTNTTPLTSQAGESSSTSEGGASQASSSGTSSTENATNKSSSSGSNFWKKTGRGLRGLGYMGKRAVTGPKGLRYRGRKLTGKALGLLGGAAGATIGVAATIAQGDESKLFQNMAIGYGAGDALGQRISETGYGLKDKVTNGASDYGNAFKEGYMSRDLETFKNEMIGKEYGGIRITEDNVEEIFNRIQELRNNSAEL